MDTSQAYSNSPSDYDVVVCALHAERCFEPFDLSIADVGSIEMSYEAALTLSEMCSYHPLSSRKQWPQ